MLARCAGVLAVYSKQLQSKIEIIIITKFKDSPKAELSLWRGFTQHYVEFFNSSTIENSKVNANYTLGHGSEGTIA